MTLNDGFVYAFDADATRLWRDNFTHGKTIMFASETAVADLNRDGSPEIIFPMFGDPNERDSGCDCLLWPTTRGGPLRMGVANTN